MNVSQQNKVGEITKEVKELLNLSVIAGTPIYIGQSNIDHMMNKHPNEYMKYGIFIKDIIDFPDYVGINPGDDSIEYVKNFLFNNEYIKVAVRVSNSGMYFARSLYFLKSSRVYDFINSGTLKPLTIK